eukprot:ANDGO_03142.mRNA.1 hypothetical protein DICPUDRAFT_75603
MTSTVSLCSTHHLRELFLRALAALPLQTKRRSHGGQKERNRSVEGEWEGLRQVFQTYCNGSDGDAVLFQHIKAAVKLCSQSNMQPPYKPSLLDVCRGSAVYVPPAPVRVRSPELEARVQRLKRELEQKEYNRMVKDVNSLEIKEKNRDSFATYGASITTGLQLGMTVFTLVTIGLYAGKQWYPDEKSAQLVCCAFFGIGGLMMEATLYIIKMYREDWKAGRRKKQQQFESKMGISKLD